MRSWETNIGGLNWEITLDSGRWGRKLNSMLTDLGALRAPTATWTATPGSGLFPQGPLKKSQTGSNAHSQDVQSCVTQSVLAGHLLAQSSMQGAVLMLAL